MARRSRSGLLLAALALAACSDESQQPAPADVEDWYAGRPPRARAHWLNLAEQDLVIRLPDARVAREDVEEEGVPRIVVNVLADGMIQVKGNTYDLSGPEAEASRDALRAFMRELASPWIPRAPVMAHADRMTDWRHVSGVLQDVVAIGLPRLQLAVAHHDPAATSRHEWRVDAVASSIPDEVPALEVRLRRAEPDSSRASPVEVVLGVARFPFPPGRFTGLATPDAARFEESNRVWALVRGALPPPPSPNAAARIAIDQHPIEWAYVHKTMDLLLDAGWRRIDFPDTGVRLDVPPAPPTIFAPSEHALPGLWTWVGAALAAVAGFAVARIGRPRTRP